MTENEIAQTALSIYGMHQHLNDNVKYSYAECVRLVKEAHGIGKDKEAEREEVGEKKPLKIWLEKHTNDSYAIFIRTGNRELWFNFSEDEIKNAPFITLSALFSKLLNALNQPENK